MELLGNLDHFVPWVYGAAVFTLEALSPHIVQGAPLWVLSGDFRTHKAAGDHRVEYLYRKSFEG